MSPLQQFAETVLIPLQLVLAMVGMGVTLRVGDFFEVIKEGWSLALGLLAQIVVAPLIAFALIEAFGLGPGWAVGIALVAVVPGGAASNLFTYIGKGNAALSIALTLVATVGCALTMPVALAVLAGPYLPPAFTLPFGAIAVDIVLFLLVPLAVGMGILEIWPTVSERLSRLCVRGALLLLIVVTASSLGTGRIELAKYGWVPPLVIILFANVLCFVGAQVPRLLRRYDDDAVAIAVEMSVRNIGVALLLVHFFFAGQPEQAQVLYTCLFYAGTSWFVAIPLIMGHRKNGRILVFGTSRPRRTVAPE